jgi:hypothetical protein
MDIANYLGQLIYVKTSNDEILMVKLLSKYNDRHKGYKVKVLQKNGQNMDLDTVIYKDEIKMICILPREVQQGIESTMGYIPTGKFEDIKNLPSVVEFGTRQENE